MLSRNPKSGLSSGEYAWEVMEQSYRYGEKPLRLVISQDAIRTITSLSLSEPTKFKEYWKVLSTNILQVSWCSELCVLSILYAKKEEPTKERSKIFLVDVFIGRKIIKCYKKIKPASVSLCYGPPKLRTKGVLENQEKNLTLNNIGCSNKTILSTSFKLKKGLRCEKFWRAMEINDNLEIREIFLGVSPSGVRIMDPISQETKKVISNLHLLGIEYSSHIGNNMLKLKYLDDKKGNGKSKHKRRIFYVLPVTAQDILSYHEHCSTLGEETILVMDFPKLKVPTINSSPAVSSGKITPINVTENGKITRSKSVSQNEDKSRKLKRGCSEGSIKRDIKRKESDKEEKGFKLKKESSGRDKEEENRSVLTEKRKNIENEECLLTEKRKNDKREQDRKESLGGLRRVRVEEEKENTQNQTEKRKMITELRADFTLLSAPTTNEPIVQVRVTKV